MEYLASRLVFGRHGLLGRRPAKVALASTALGVVAMVVAMALMSGYRTELEDRLLLGGADLGVYPFSPTAVEGGERLAFDVEAIPMVESVDRVAYGQGSLLPIAGGGGVREAVTVTVRGVNPGSRFWGRSFDLASGDGAVLGAGLAADTGLEIGDRARLMLMDTSGARPRFRYRSVLVTEIVETGYHEFDASWLVVGRDFLEDAAGVSSSLEVQLRPDADIGDARDAISASVGSGYEVRDFRAPNQALFDALAAQQVLLFLLLGLIVIVATANVASALVVLIRERRRDLGVLAAVGLDGRSLGRTLFESGLLLTLIGTALGLVVGAAAAWVLDRFELIRLSDDLAAVYFLSAVPFHLRLADLVGVALLAVTAGALASAVPAARAATLKPARALRAE